MEFAIFGILHRVILSRVIFSFICSSLFFPSWLPLLLTLVPDCCFCLSTQGINSTSSWVYDQATTNQVMSCGNIPESTRDRYSPESTVHEVIYVIFCWVSGPSTIIGESGKE